MNKYLRMSFKCNDDSRRTIIVPNPKDDITAAQIQSAATIIINANVYVPPLTQLVDADIVTTNDLV